MISEYLASRNFKETTLNVAAEVTQLPGGRAIIASANEPLSTIFLRMMGMETMNVVVNAGAERYRIDADTEAIGLREMAETLAGL